jgi:hypothetical protein
MDSEPFYAVCIKGKYFMKNSGLRKNPEGGS